VTAAGKNALFTGPGWRNSPGPLFYGRGPVSDALRRLESVFESHGLARIYVGRVATNAHGHTRGTHDIDVCLRPNDLEAFLRLLDREIHGTVPGRVRRITDQALEVEIDLIPSGKVVGLRPQQRSLCFPDPSEAELCAGIPVPTLARLIELKLALWRFKDWGDVVELIRVRGLDQAFANELDAAVRSIYLRCYDERVEEDRCEPQIPEAPEAREEAK
jgi:hypothetical protein